VAGLEQTQALISMTLTMLKRMITGDISLSHLSGPISIADFSGQAIQSGWVQFLTLMALLSLSLGILNLLPIPMLDGGHLTYYVYEMIRGKPVSEGFEMAAQRVGFLMIAGLTLLAISNDLLRLSNG
jgi:regulator of sigma E protease